MISAHCHYLELRPYKALHTHSYFIIYKKCFGTLTCCGWAERVHPYTLAHGMVLVCFSTIGVGLGLNDVVRLWLRLQTPIERIPHHKKV